ncbi:MAG TPA: radical SAM protein [Bacillota bacterium]|nr:radical SAM protein [Bacillota bacterium]
MKESSETTLGLERVNLSVTKFCNLHCRMCDFKKIHRPVRNFSLDTVKTIIKEMAALGAKVLEISGGEPMTRKDIYEIITFAHSFGLKVAMMTNGVLIGPAEADKLLKAGLTSVTFSLEGPEQLNDQLRGRGNFQKTLRAIASFLNHPNSAEINVEIGITLSKYNYSLIVSFAKYLFEEVKVNSIAINPFNAGMLDTKNQRTRESEFIITADLIPDLTKVVEELIEYGKVAPGKLPSPNYLGKIPDYFMGKKLIPANGCQIPMSHCGVTVNGWVFSCWQNPPLGNLKDASLTEILTSETQRKLSELALAGKCKGCLSSCFAEIH